MDYKFGIQGETDGKGIICTVKSVQVRNIHPKCFFIYIRLIFILTFSPAISLQSAIKQIKHRV